MSAAANASLIRARKRHARIQRIRTAGASIERLQGNRRTAKRCECGRLLIRVEDGDLSRPLWECPTCG